MTQEQHTQINNLDREQIVTILEDSLGTACYDDEPLSDLKECLIESVNFMDPEDIDALLYFDE